MKKLMYTVAVYSRIVTAGKTDSSTVFLVSDRFMTISFAVPFFIQFIFKLGSSPITH